MESKRGQAGCVELVKSFPLNPGVQLTMLGVYTLLLLWGLATPSLGLLETVGTLARIDKDELGKGESGAGGQTGGTPLQLSASEADIRAEALSAQLALSAIFCGDPGGSSSTHPDMDLLFSSSSGHCCHFLSAENWTVWSCLELWTGMEKGLTGSYLYFMFLR